MPQRELDFRALDELLQAFLMGALSLGTQTLYSLGPGRIGPTTELMLQRRHLSTLNGTPLASASPAKDLHSAMASSGTLPSGTSFSSHPIEFSRIPPALESLSEPKWIAFNMRLKHAATSAGFTKKTAAGITGAFGEMVDNSVRHSERQLTAIAGYSWKPGFVEFVVADAGVGVLTSLRRHPNYGHLQDHGTALFTALTPGESRYGRGTGHGTGFKTLFASLADLNGFLRFRSGDHALEIDGTNPDLTNARVSQCPPFYEGFFVSVLVAP